MKAIFKILPAAGGKFAAVNYNAKKVNNGSAQLLLFKNFGLLEAQDIISKDEFEAFLIDWSDRNKKIRNPVFHAVLSAEGYSVPHEQLKDMAEEIMNGLGYSDSPMLIYAHSDTSNAHVHIVTSRVSGGINGKKINDSFEGKRANQLLNNILKISPGEAFKTNLEEALKYKTGSEAQFRLLMEQRGYDVKRKDDGYVFYKHGKEQGSIETKRIRDKINSDKQLKSNAAQIRAILFKYRKNYSGELKSNRDIKFTTAERKFESDLTRFMKHRFGMDFIFFTGKDAGKPYGYAIIDHLHKEVIKGSDAMKLSDLVNDRLLTEKEQPEENLKNPNRSNSKPGIINGVATNENKERFGLAESLLDTDYSAAGSAGNNSVKTRFGGQDDEDDYRRKRRRKR